MSAPAFDTRVWRVLGNPLNPGDPLLPGAADGPLSGHDVAVKDLYAVAGQRVGAGNPTWLAQASVEPLHAAAVARLIAGGASIRGITRTDELAYSLAGTNAHYGTPPNPAAPGRISGGSSSGSASAVALGQARIGLGTDTGGSVRVPAAYQGLFGIRTTHGAIDTTGLLPLAPSYDTVGWLTRSAALLASVGNVLLPGVSPGVSPGTDGLVVVPALQALAAPQIRDAITALVPAARPLGWTPGLDGWVEAFRVVQAAEAWRAHGRWLAGRLDVLGPDVRGRFTMASAVTAQQESAARSVTEQARAEIRDVIGDRVLVLPSASSAAPTPDGGDVDAVRATTLRLTCIAGLGGLPAVSVPLTSADGLPCGACLVAAPGRDHELLELAQTLAGEQR